MEEIARSLRKWNPWWADNTYIRKLKGFERVKKLELLKLLRFKQVKDILGVRRCGKTTLMYQIIDHLISKNIDSKKIVFVKLDDISMIAASFKDIENSIFYSVEKPEYLFLDEVQEKKGWETWVKNLYDANEFKQIFLTGSNASLLSRDLSRLLTGRHLSSILLPFSFKEYLTAKKWKNFSWENLKLNETRIIKYLKEYVETSGFPETINKDIYETKILLSEIYNNIISRDIALRHSVEPDKIKDLIYYLITNSGVEYSYRKISKFTGLNVETIERYISLAEDSFLVFRVNVFSYKLKTQFKQNKKIYCIDQGFLNSVALKFSKNLGKIYETIVAIELKRRNKDFYYWKDKAGKEADFVIKEKLKIEECIQVCYDLNNEKTEKRELDGLVSACKNFNLKKGTIINNNVNKEKNVEGIKIKYLPLWEWLLK